MSIKRFRDFELPARRCLDAGVPFVIVAPMGVNRPTWLCDNGGTPVSDTRFVAVPWLGKFSDGTVIRDVLTPEQAMKLQAGSTKQTHSEQTATYRDEYLQRVTELIGQLKTTGGKTVISRTIIGENDDIIAAAVSYLDNASTDSYRCMFYTPHTGCWAFASPETLCDVRGGIIETMALAGTRQAGSQGDWDSKNIDEQEMVRSFIVDALTHCGCTHINCTTSTCRAAAVEHILTRITARMTAASDFCRIIDTLNPTPALCGLPRDISIRRIDDIERHDRAMYGGYTALCTDNGITTAVTLRCARISPGRWCIYSGGGITKDSEAESEWRETQLKAKPLLQFFAQRPYEQSTAAHPSRIVEPDLNKKSTTAGLADAVKI